MPRSRVYVVVAILAILTLTLAGRLAYLQVVRHDFYRRLASSEHWRQSVLPARRGESELTMRMGHDRVEASVEVGLCGGCHRLPHVFENPDRFDPDRLAPPREEDKRTPYSLVTFGGGPRVCIGQHFAHVETKALLAHVLRNYRLEPAGDQRPAHAGFFNAFIPGGVRVRVTPL